MDDKVWTQKSELPQINFLRSLTQPKISRQRPSKITDINCDQIKDATKKWNLLITTLLLE